MNQDNVRVSRCISTLHELVVNLEANITSFSDSVVASTINIIDTGLDDLASHACEALDAIISQWKISSLSHKLTVLAPGSRVLVGMCNTDNWAMDFGVSSINHGQAEVVYSQKFSLSEFKWDHPYDVYVSGVVDNLTWENGDTEASIQVKSSRNQNGPFASVIIDDTCASSSLAFKEIVVPVTHCIPWEKFDDSEQPSLGQYFLLPSQGIYEPIKLVEVEHEEEESGSKKMFTFQYKSKKILRASSQDHVFLKTPNMLDEILEQCLSKCAEETGESNGRDKFSLAICSWWRQALDRHYRKNHWCGLPEATGIIGTKVMQVLEDSHREFSETPMPTGSSCFFRTAPTVLQFGHAEIERTKVCRDAFRMIEDACNLFSVIVRSSPSSMSEDDTQSVDGSTSSRTRQESVDGDEDGMNVSAMAFAASGLGLNTSGSYSGSVDSRMGAISSAYRPHGKLLQSLVLLSKAADECLHNIQRSHTPALFEVPSREWCLNMCSLLTARDAMMNLLSQIASCGDSEGVDSIEALLVQRAADFHEVIPEKCDEGVMQAGHVFEAMIMDDICREGVICDVVNVLSHHKEIAKRICVGILTVAGAAPFPSEGHTNKERYFRCINNCVYYHQAVARKNILPVEESPGELPAHMSHIERLQRTVFFDYCKKKGDVGDNGTVYSWGGRLIDLVQSMPAPEVVSDDLPSALSEMHVEDYGFGDVKSQNVKHLVDSLLELMMLTYIHISAPSGVSHLMSSVKRIFLNNSQPSLHDSIDVTEELLGLMSLPAVCVANNKSLSLSGVLELIQLPTIPNEESASNTPTNLNSSANNGPSSGANDDSSKMTGSLTASHATRRRVSLRYDAVGDMEVCCGNTALPTYSTFEDNQTPACMVYCLVSRRVLKLVTVKALWLINALSNRPELVLSEYPQLTESEQATAREVKTFMERFSDLSDRTMLVW